MNQTLIKLICGAFMLVPGITVPAQQTEIKYLSGTGADQTVDWQFFCTDGQNSGKWTSIPVPSNWELQGFGTYNYGHAKDEERGKETGRYRFDFETPAHWKGRVVNIVFEGSMTDTEVKINGKLAGPIHQGSFYRFKYDISRLLKYGSTNLLEVTVAKHSANESVNRAERYADFWIFGGIFRPVYLEVKPQQNIERVAIDAKADGSLTAEVFIQKPAGAEILKAQVFDLNGNLVGREFSTEVEKGSTVIRLQSNISGVKSWNPEGPNLYQVTFSLISKGKEIHQVTERIGFRTVEVRDRDGVYVNGVKIKFKGVNRHTFRPETGRASCKAFSIEDVRLMKEMNMNAVRMSHYPPDKHFLEVCDSLGLFVMNELAGWHDAYDTRVGSKLVKEMVIRDVNHPSVVFWSNGNEGGHNFDLDPLFAQYDIQNRRVIHPWNEFNGFATQHYRAYDYGAGSYWNGHLITMPTEFLHGMYDGGHGAGLWDYWELMWNKSRAAGGFLWVFADEGVVRTDQNGAIDTYGSSAPDGILGPHHEKEGSFFAIKEIWSPVRPDDSDITADFGGKINLENRYFYTNLNQCRFSWKLTKFPLPGSSAQVKTVSGTALAPDIAPGQKGTLQLELPADWASYDALYFTAADRFGNELYTWSRAIKLPADLVAQLLAKSNGNSAVSFTETGLVYRIKAGTVEYSIGKTDGVLKKVVNEKGEIPFRNGPEISAGLTAFKSLEMKNYGDSLMLICSFKTEKSDSTRMKEFVWTFYPNGWARLHLYYVPEFYDRDFDYMGVNFSYPEELVTGVKWLGRGPYRVWKNRMQGVELGLHQKDYNNTVTGVAPVVYPEFKGYHANLYWARIESKEQSFTVATSDEDVFLRLYTPAQPEKVFERTAPAFPAGDISFMQAIPPIGTKSNDPWDMGPSGKKNMFFDYGPYDNWRSRSKQMTLYFNFSE
ncbi:glycoside hydrolase family 2 TIM barrel-domain containing protein [Gaoshiqia sp. Z1-71]|uniref:glycoside hydrolase family 2 TIM barrel-domain containing protein n=1 Tax=Gaoshiqia hydrogeniformans TaxID=3290090 RepID=UPI003BF84350